MDKFDVFKEVKMQSFFESQQAVKSLCTYLQELITNMENMTEIQLRDNFLKLLQVSVSGILAVAYNDDSCY